MTEQEDIDAVAAEYVLGTLDAGERAAVAARRSREQALDEAIRGWEKRLGPLAEGVPPVAPSDGLFRRIEARIAGLGAAAGTGAAVTAAGNVVELERRMKRWRGVAVAASALAASLALVIGVREYRTLQEPSNFVGVFQKDDVSPAFLLAVDIKTRQLTIRRVAAEPQPGKTYQLWIASSRTGGRPESLGLISGNETRIERALLKYEPEVLENATFGVSLEPAGGSPTGQPSAGALHTKLMPALP